MNEIIKELLEKNNVLTVAIIMIIILGLIYLIKKGIQVLISKEMEDVKNQNTKNIEELRSGLDKQKQKIEHTHQVSQPTYQRLFDKKIRVYAELIQIQLEYKIQSREKRLVSKDFYDNVDHIIQNIKKLVQFIESNELSISNNLVKISEKIINILNDFDSEFMEINIYYQNNPDALDPDPYVQVEDNQKIYSKIYYKIEEDLLTFEKILHEDISKIKTKINLD